MTEKFEPTSKTEPVREATVRREWVTPAFSVISLSRAKADTGGNFVDVSSILA
jgi:hypothetical protein